MKVVRVEKVIEAPGIEVEQLWHDRSRWASWIDGFAHLDKLEGDWPLEGSRRVWSTPPGGRGLVAERVLKYVAGSGLTLMVEDERITAMQRVRFETDNVRTRITIEIEPQPKQKMAPGPQWWMRRKLRESLERSFQRFAYELDGDR